MLRFIWRGKRRVNTTLFHSYLIRQVHQNKGFSNTLKHFLQVSREQGFLGESLLFNVLQKRCRCCPEPCAASSVLWKQVYAMLWLVTWHKAAHIKYTPLKSRTCVRFRGVPAVSDAPFPIWLLSAFFVSARPFMSKQRYLGKNNYLKVWKKSLAAMKLSTLPCGRTSWRLYDKTRRITAIRSCLSVEMLLETSY